MISVAKHCLALLCPAAPGSSGHSYAGPVGARIGRAKHTALSMRELKFSEARHGVGRERRGATPERRVKASLGTAESGNNRRG